MPAAGWCAVVIVTVTFNFSAEMGKSSVGRVEEHYSSLRIVGDRAHIGLLITKGIYC
jgi:hypothetical protein